VPKLFLVATALLASTSTSAADLLPLMHGNYAREGTPCVGASNVDRMSYWGGRNGLNIQQAGCAIRAVTRRGTVYSLSRRCRSIRFGGVYSDRISVRIHGRTAFTLLASPPGQDWRFRYCGPGTR